jgi:hypothetical protein
MHDEEGQKGDFYKSRQENKQIILAWFSTVLTMIGFVWQAAVLWTTNEETGRRVEVLERRSVEDSKAIARMEASLELLSKRKE